MNSEIGDWLKSRRLGMGVSIRQLAKLIKIPHTTIANIEKGMKPSINVLKKIAAYFKLSEKYLFVMAGVIDSEEKAKSAAVIAIENEMNGLPRNTQEDILEYAKFKRRQFEESEKNN